MRPSIYKQFEKSVLQYRMIQEEDRIIAGLSGTDSLVMLRLLADHLKYRKVSFDLQAVHVDVGFPNSDRLIALLESFCHSIDIPFHHIPTRIYETAFHPKAKKNPCFICSLYRRRKLYQYAHDHNFNLIAYGHHKDDIIETLLLNILYGRKIEAMSPVQSIFKGTFFIIRPMAYTDEAAIKAWAKKQNMPSMPHYCPMDGQSRREKVKVFIRSLQENEPNANIRENIFKSLDQIHLRPIRQSIRPESLD
ncbi:MAG TPA: tRNA 2-thiocytidine biosynthesis protein TtcA [bacterium]|nr:tRNA 2-thiocytidine biosynthesis protein TtcA [bacterium]